MEKKDVSLGRRLLELSEEIPLKKGDAMRTALRALVEEADALEELAAAATAMATGRQYTYHRDQLLRSVERLERVRSQR